MYRPTPMASFRRIQVKTEDLVLTDENLMCNRIPYAPQVAASATRIAESMTVSFCSGPRSSYSEIAGSLNREPVARRPYAIAGGTFSSRLGNVKRHTGAAFPRHSNVRWRPADGDQASLQPNPIQGSKIGFSGFERTVFMPGVQRSRCPTGTKRSCSLHAGARECIPLLPK